MEVNIPVSLGELLDKISILEIKNKKITNESKLVNIKNIWTPENWKKK